jgi:hypothetical protein
MNPFVKIILIAYAILYVLCAFVSWDYAVLAHTTEGARVGFIFGGLLFSTIGACLYQTIQDEKK